MRMYLRVVSIMFVLVLSGCINQTTGGAPRSEFSEMKLLAGVNHNDYDITDEGHFAPLWVNLGGIPNEDMNCYMTVDGETASDNVLFRAGSGLLQRTAVSIEKYSLSDNQVIEFGLCCDGECKTRNYVTRVTSGSGSYLKVIPVECVDDEGKEIVKCY